MEKSATPRARTSSDSTGHSNMQVSTFAGVRGDTKEADGKALRSRTMANGIEHSFIHIQARFCDDLVLKNACAEVTKLASDRLADIEPPRRAKVLARIVESLLSSAAAMAHVAVEGPAVLTSMVQALVDGMGGAGTRRHDQTALLALIPPSAALTEDAMRSTPASFMKGACTALRPQVPDGGDEDTHPVFLRLFDPSNRDEHEQWLGSLFRGAVAGFLADRAHGEASLKEMISRLGKDAESLTPPGLAAIAMGILSALVHAGRDEAGVDAVVRQLVTEVGGRLDTPLRLCALCNGLAVGLADGPRRMHSGLGWMLDRAATLPVGDEKSRTRAVAMGCGVGRALAERPQLLNALLQDLRPHKAGKPLLPQVELGIAMSRQALVVLKRSDTKAEEQSTWAVLAYRNCMSVQAVPQQNDFDDVQEAELPLDGLSTLLACMLRRADGFVRNSALLARARAVLVDACTRAVKEDVRRQVERGAGKGSEMTLSRAVRSDVLTEVISFYKELRDEIGRSYTSAQSASALQRKSHGAHLQQCLSVVDQEIEALGSDDFLKAFPTMCSMVMELLLPMRQHIAIEIARTTLDEDLHRLIASAAKLRDLRALTDGVGKLLCVTPKADSKQAGHRSRDGVAGVRLAASSLASAFRQVASAFGLESGAYGACVEELARRLKGPAIKDDARDAIVASTIRTCHQLSAPEQYELSRQTMESLCRAVDKEGVSESHRTGLLDWLFCMRDAAPVGHPADQEVARESPSSFAWSADLQDAPAETAFRCFAGLLRGYVTVTVDAHSAGEKNLHQLYGYMVKYVEKLGCVTAAGMVHGTLAGLSPQGDDLQFLSTLWKDLASASNEVAGFVVLGAALWAVESGSDVLLSVLFEQLRKSALAGDSKADVLALGLAASRYPRERLTRWAVRRDTELPAGRQKGINEMQQALTEAAKKLESGDSEKPHRQNRLAALLASTGIRPLGRQEKDPPGGGSRRRDLKAEAT